MIDNRYIVVVNRCPCSPSCVTRPGQSERICKHPADFEAVRDILCIVIHSALHDTPKKKENQLLTSNASNASSHNIVHGLSDAFCSSGGSGTSFVAQTRRGKQRGIRIGVANLVAERLSGENVPTPTESCAGAGAGIGTRERTRAAAAAESEKVPPPPMLTLTLLAPTVAVALRATRPGW
jgi:hypothetical protein